MRAKRNALVVENLNVARAIAGRMRATYPFADLDDLKSAGKVGLMEAAEKFDPEVGVPFNRYCVSYIRNRIHDANRRRESQESGHEELPAALANREEEPLDTTIYVHGLMDQCDALERRVILMYHWDGMTQGEIGKVLEMPRTTVSALYNKAIRKLKGGPE